MEASKSCQITAHLIGDGLVVYEVLKGHRRCPGVILVVDAGAERFFLFPLGDSQLVPQKQSERSIAGGVRRAVEGLAGAARGGGGCLHFLPPLPTTPPSEGLHLHFHSSS